MADSDALADHAFLVRSRVDHNILLDICPGADSYLSVVSHDLRAWTYVTLITDVNITNYVC
jgi:hypothetical protein